MTIDGTRFGDITIDGVTYDHDVVIRLSGEVVKRKKKLSKKQFGSSHTVSEEEMAFVWEKGAETLVFGTGQSGVAHLSPDAERFLKGHGCRVVQQPTPQAIRTFNHTGGARIGLFHVTC